MVLVSDEDLQRLAEEKGPTSALGVGAPLKKKAKGEGEWDPLHKYTTLQISLYFAPQEILSILGGKLAQGGATLPLLPVSDVPASVRAQSASTRGGPEAWAAGRVGRSDGERRGGVGDPKEDRVAA